jgi:fatty acid synthase subunit alpha, fungi type
LIDLDQVVVIAGFAEVGPWGGSRTRWEMEARGEFTFEGCIEMAWIMGFINLKHFDGRLKDGSLYVGWVNSKTNEPVDDKKINFMLAYVLSVSATRLFYIFNLTLPFRT